MFIRKFLTIQFYSVLSRPRKYGIKSTQFMSLHYKHNYLKYYLCHNCNTLKLRDPFETSLKKHFSKTATFGISNAIDEKKNFAASFREIALLLNSEETEIMHLFKKHPKLLTNFDLENTLAKLSLLLNQFPKPTIKKNICVLELPLDELEGRLNAMKKWELDDATFGEFLPLFKMPSKDFYRMSAKFIVEKNIVKHKNRIVFIANEMQCPVEEVVEKFLQFKFLLFRNFREIESNIIVLKEFGIPSETFLQEFSVLNVTSEKLRRRLKKQLECGLINNLSLIHCAETLFADKIQREIEKNKILSGWASTEEYISHVLNLTPEEIMDLKMAHSKIFNMDIVKMKKMLEFLLSCGYTTKQISLFPTIFNYSYLKVKERYAELESFGITLPKLTVLCLNQKIYDRLIEGLKRKKTEEIPSEKKTTRKKLQSKEKPSA
ncbi:uncharacterized protein LOC135838524 [Planococcus citri]|uniref:uncharacterized protein LOC135838524 n=1 Tax=Planococcus citri TaxID=170843 RepID=UPI0031F8DECB